MIRLLMSIRRSERRVVVEYVIVGLWYWMGRRCDVSSSCLFSGAVGFERVLSRSEGRDRFLQ